MSVKAISLILLWRYQIKRDAPHNSAFTFMWQFFWRTTRSSLSCSEVSWILDELSVKIPEFLSQLKCVMIYLLLCMCNVDGSRNFSCSIWSISFGSQSSCFNILSSFFLSCWGKWAIVFRDRRKASVRLYVCIFHSKYQWSPRVRSIGKNSEGCFVGDKGLNLSLCHEAHIFTALLSDFWIVIIWLWNFYIHFLFCFSNLNVLIIRYLCPGILFFQLNCFI